MGFIGKIIQHFLNDSIREVVTELQANYSKTSILILPPGIDACPILGDQATLTGFDKQVGLYIDDAGHSAIIGVIPPGLVNEGEIKILSRDIATGQEMASFYFKADGAMDLISSTDKLITLKNTVESFKTILDDLIEEIKAIKTFGSPTNHTIDPATITLLDAIKTRISTLFGA